MDEVIQLEDLLAFYPPKNIEGIQTKITAKKEFKELESSPREVLQRIRGGYFKHQKFIQRFLQHYDRLLLFHETGTGKSCAITAAAEILKKEHQSSDNNKFLSGGYIKRAYVIVNNKQLKGRMKKEIICKCTDQVYDTPDVEDSKQKVHRNLEKWYTVTERESFARKLSKMTNKGIIEEYSNSIIFVDEAHNLRFRAFKGEKRRAETKAVKIKRRLLNRFSAKGLRNLAENLEIPVSGTKEDIINLMLDEDILTIENINEAIDSDNYAMSTKKKEKKEPFFGKESIYVQFWRLFHVARNIKIVLATATPMVNDPSEIKDLLNLLLPARTEDFSIFKRKLTTSEMGPLFAISPERKIEDMSEKELEYYFRGLVSYVRRLDTGADIEYQGIPISNIGGYSHSTKTQDYKTETKVFLSRLGDFQSEIYKRVRQLKQNELRDKERQVSNFVYPDGSFGLAGFNKYIRQIGDRYTVKNTSAGREFADQISTLDGIRNLGAKFADIIEIINETPGNVFVYSNYSKASGAVPFSVCLEAQGYELFREDDMNSIFRPRFVTTAQAYCSGISGGKVIRDSFLPAGREKRDGTIQKPRYVFLTPDISVNALEVLLTVMNSPENKHGDYIKVFITTPVGGEGISLSNVIGIHLIDGDWKHATNYQAESRAIRATSHDELLKEKSRINVKVYNHAAYTCDSLDMEVKVEEEDVIYPCKENQLLSVDIRLYERSEEKDREIKRMERIMKKVAVDCQIHFLRNTRRDDPRIIGKDGTSECDYEKCVYTCVDPKPVYEDYTTYDVYYINEPIEAVRRVLQEYFKTEFSITMKGILDLIWNEEYSYLYIDIPLQIKYIQYAVEEILTNKPIFQNRYGQNSYLQKDENTLFLSLDYPLSSVEAEEINVSDYTRNLIGVMDIPLEDFENPEKEKEQRKLLNKLKKYDIFSPEFEESFYQLDIDTLSSSLEDAIERHINRKETAFSRNILDRLSENLHPASKGSAGTPDSKWFPVPFASLWHRVPKPVTELKNVEKRFKEKSQGKGRKPKEGNRAPDEIDYEPTWDKETESTYFHILYSIEPGRNVFNTVSNFNNVKRKIRLFIPSEGKWRDANPIEQVVYSKIGQERIEEFKQPYENEPIHGFYISGPIKAFRLGVKFMEKQPRKKSVKKKKKDQRTVNRGRICESYSVEDLIRILNFLEIPSPNLEELENIERLNREQLIDNIANSKGFKTFKSDELDEKTLQYYLSWILFKPRGPKRKFICSIIQENLLRRGLVYQTY